MHATDGRFYAVIRRGKIAVSLGLLFIGSQCNVRKNRSRHVPQGRKQSLRRLRFWNKLIISERNHVSYLWPISWAIVYASAKPLSSFTLQLLSLVQSPLTRERPDNTINIMIVIFPNFFEGMLSSRIICSVFWNWRIKIIRDCFHFAPPRILSLAGLH